MNAALTRTGDILVCFALSTEARPFRKYAATRRNICVLCTGMGQANAHRVVERELSRLDPELVLTCGFAGGLRPELTLGTVLFEADEDFPLRLALLDAGAHPARFSCAERVTGTVLGKRMLLESTGADAVEMESQVIRSLCAERRLPCATVRVVSDTALEDLPLDFNQFLTTERNTNYLKLLSAVVRQPEKLSALLRFHRQLQTAAEKLATVLAQVLEPRARER